MRGAGVGALSHRSLALGPTLVLCGLVAACASPSGASPTHEVPSWKVGASAVTMTSAPDIGGPLSFRNCPTLAEATTAVPVLSGGPEANAVPFKTMVLQCVYPIKELDVQGHAAVVAILVFDASAEGAHLWDSSRTDPAFPNPIDIPGLADVAFSTGVPGHSDVWVVQGGYGFHMYHTRSGDIPVEQMVALARAMLAGLGR